MIIETKKLNFTDLRKWTGKDGLPILSFLSVYQAAGLLEPIQKYVEESEDKSIIAMQQLFCNFYTFQKIRNLIKESWSRHYLTIKGDNKVEWIEGKRHDVLSYDRTLSKKIQTAITMDAANYACGIDDTLDDDVIIFTNGEEDEVADEVNTTAEA